MAGTHTIASMAIMSAVLTFRENLLQQHFMTSEPVISAADPAPPSLYPLADLGLIEVSGTDAETFLNAQLSRNVSSGEPPRATLAAWHDAKGRVLAVFRTIWTGERWLLLANGADVEALSRRLRMYVLRADVRLRNASEEWRAAAVLGGIDRWLERRSITLGEQPGDAVMLDGAFFVRVGPRLAWLVAAGEFPEDLESDCPVGHDESGAVEEIRLGLVDVTPELTGRYTAHMLNLDRLGAVAFDKGCFPGQEVIARTENLGRVKRRVFRFSGELKHVPAVGSALLDSSGNAAGEVVRAATTAEKRVELLAVVRVDAALCDLTCADEVSVPLARDSLPGD